MRAFMKVAAMAVLLLVPGLALAAERVALVIANSNYRALPDVRGALRAPAAVQALSGAGFDVLFFKDVRRSDIAARMAMARRKLDGAQQVVVVLGGQYASTPWDSWLLAVDAPRVDAFSAGSSGISINALLDMVTEQAGRAVVLAAVPDQAGRFEKPVENGLSVAHIPQGVTLISGGMEALLQVLNDGLLVAGNTTADLAANLPDGLSIDGFVSDVVPFLPAPSVAPEVSGRDDQILWWDRARAQKTKQAVQDYLDRYPDGLFAPEARQMLAELAKTPEDRAREAEAALNLSREARQNVQRDLSILGFDPHGIDGIFGRGTRAAIRSWQRAQGFAPTGYLDRDQLAALTSAGRERARQLQEEAKRRQAEQDRLDAIYWNETGRDGSEAGLRAYLKRYPDGLYSDIARERLNAIEAERARTAAAAERRAWEQAKAADTVEAYEAFLKRYPNGAFSDNAKERIDELKAEAARAAELAQAKADEAQVLANPITRVLVERRLAELGLKPGKVDGVIDDKTRKALRRFQRAANLPVTGYATQETVVRLLAGQGG